MTGSGRRGSGKKSITNGIISMKTATGLPAGGKSTITGMILARTVYCRPDAGSMSIMWEPMAGCLRTPGLADTSMHVQTVFVQIDLSKNILNKIYHIFSSKSIIYSSISSLISRSKVLFSSIRQLTLLYPFLLSYILLRLYRSRTYITHG